MGYLLKEALKALCGVNQWCYAVFWKTGCQNPKLLIWEECYYEPASCSRRHGISGSGISEIAFPDYNFSSVSAENHNLRSGIPAGDKVHLLVNKMMMDNHVNIVGEGLVGRVAFTGNHQWILSENYYREIHPPEVLKEVCLQFSAGMQTVAVIPILPHGVVQFGSYLMIAENMGFVNDVVSLILELGCVPGVLQSENYEAKEFPPESNMINASSFVADSLNYIGCSAQTPAFYSQITFSVAREPKNEMQSSLAAFQASNSSSCHLKPHDYHEEAKTAQAMKLDFSFPNHFVNGVAKAEVIPNSVAQMNQHSSPRIPRSIKDLSSSRSSGLNHDSNTKPMSGIYSLSDDNKAASGNIASVHTYSTGLTNINLSKMELSFSDSGDRLTTNPLIAYCPDTNDHPMNKKFAQSELNQCKEEIEQNVMLIHDIPLTRHTEKPSIAELIPGFVGDDRKQKSGDDLFDILGADFKDKWFSSCSKSPLRNELATNMHNWDKNNSPSKNNMATSEIYSSSQGNSDSGIFSFTGTDHLLDAVVSKAHPFSKRNSEDTVSCRTTLNNTSSYSTPNALLPYERFGVSDNVKGDLSGIPKYMAKAGAMSSSSLRTGSSKEELGTYSHGSSIYDPWIERGHNMRQSNSVATGYSNKPHEGSKTNRKRLKPGESPRPRPKDRQMIQDRVKELREIVPNGTKCSIDALLERTIKHMLFLQSVTKHADKLKQTAESKIISKDGGLLLKDDYGGATWAYEVGSQSMVCPIIVEDLNQPHQMLVEMLCEERGLFLEIADIIRGLGLTILKGLMETRNDKIWARFAVEANRKVTRMEIFLSLVRLLEQNAKSGVPQPNSTENMMVQEFHQATAIPADGGSIND